MSSPRFNTASMKKMLKLLSPGSNTTSFNSSNPGSNSSDYNLSANEHRSLDTVERRRKRYTAKKEDKRYNRYQAAYRARIEAYKKAERNAAKFKTLRNAVVKEAAKVARMKTDSYKAEQAARKAKATLRKAAALEKAASNAASMPKTARYLRAKSRANRTQKSNRS